MKISDLYPGMKAANTQEMTNPKAQSPGQALAANDGAKGKKTSGGYGMIAILVIAGILIGSKFVLEK